MVALAPLDPAPCYQCALCGHTLSGAEVGATIDWATQEVSSCLQVSHITLLTHASYHLHTIQNASLELCEETLYHLGKHLHPGHHLMIEVTNLLFITPFNFYTSLTHTDIFDFNQEINFNALSG